MIEHYKKLSRNEKIAVFVGVCFVVVYMITPILNLTERFTSFPLNNKFSEEPIEQLVIQELIIGEGQLAEIGDLLVVTYNGSLVDGTTFDSNVGRAPFTFRLGAGNVIEGWEIGTVGMREGGSRLLIIPPHLGYGENVAGVIPPDSTLIFEIKLIQVIKEES